MKNSTISFRNVSVWYDEKIVLKDTNLDVYENEMALLIGPTGCGKSTLCLCINGIIPHKIVGTKVEGQIVVYGKNVLESSVSEMSRDVAMVFQNPDEQLTCLYVEDEVAFGAENMKVPREEVVERVDEALEFVGLSELRERIVYDMSGGQKQRLAIATALAMRPKILVLDSPVSNLDPQGRTETLQVIDKIRKEHELTILVVEHKVDEIIPMVDRIIVMDKEGHVIRQGNPREIIEKDADYFRKELGMWLPEVSELAYNLKHQGIIDRLKVFPLSVDELVKAISLSELSFRGKGTEPQFLLKPKQYGESLIIVENVTFSYPDGTVAVKDASFNGYQGEFIAIVGQNGSGKTTLAYNLIGILKPTSGYISIDGMDTRKTLVDIIARTIGYVFQYPEHQFISDQVSKEVAHELRKLGLTEEEIEKRTNNTLYELKLLEYKNSHPYNLSLGQKRLLSATTMMLTNPKAVILDEPTYGQDAAHVYQLMNYAKGLNDRGCTIIMITHDMRLVAEYAGRVIAMNFGRIVYDGDPRSFFTKHELLKELQLAPPPVTEASIKLFGVPLLTVDEFLQYVGA